MEEETGREFCVDKDIHPLHLKVSECCKEASQNSHPERAGIVLGQGASEDMISEKNPTPQKQEISSGTGMEPWFQDGLKFQCTGCGKCCTGSPGYVYLSQPDLEKLSTHFQMSETDFCRTYTRYVDGQYALLDTPGSYDCIFLKDNRCMAYEARPVQCRTFPWWIHNLRDPKDWEEAAQRCEGINHPDAPVVSSLHIQEQCLTYLDNLLAQNFDL